MAATPNEFITIGRVIGPWGVKGKIRIASLTDFPERFDPGETIYLEAVPYFIEQTDWHKGYALVRLKGVETIARAEKFTGQVLSIRHDRVRQLPAGKYYYYQIIGLNVLTTDGREIGPVSEILTSSANDVYVVESTGGAVLIPATDAVIKTIDLDKRILIIEPLSGLLDLNKKDL